MPKKLSSLHDLSSGDRQYLKGLGVKKDFDKMDIVEQREWKEECQVHAYRETYKHKEAVGAITFGGIDIPKGRKQNKHTKKCTHRFNADTFRTIDSRCELCKKTYQEIYN